MVAAVANAGALGILYTTGYQTTKQLRDGLREVKSLTDQAFAVNINLFPTTRPVDIEAFIDEIHDEGVRIVETSGRNPKDYVSRIKEGGTVFIHKVARVRDGVKAAGLGADAVEIVGFESGGHPGEEDVSLMIQTQLLVRAIDVPVIPAGGVVDGRGLAAMLALGAEGVCMGTRFLATKECPVHENLKHWILEALPSDTVIVQRSLDNSMRVAKTAAALEVLELEARHAEPAELLAVLGGSLTAEMLCEGRLATAGLVCAGQTAGLITDIPSVQELVERTVAEAEACCAHLHSLSRKEEQDSVLEDVPPQAQGLTR
jgi:nitronate monooxygenase